MATVTSKVTWPNYSTTNVQSVASKTDNTSLSKDAFLQLLVTQLKNQDPLQPQDNAEFISQMAQFTSVEQLMNMSEQLSALNQNLGTASGMIGKTVSWYELDDKGTTNLISDVVDSIVSSEGTLYAKFSDNTLIKLTDIVTISETNGAEEDSDTAGSSEDTSAEGADTP